MNERDIRLASAISALPFKGAVRDSNINELVAKDVLDQELGYDGAERAVYDLDQKTRDVLLAHGRKDAAHALLNTVTLLGRVQTLTRLVRALIVIVAILAVVAVILAAIGAYWILG